ncbi:MAG: SusC/RagA family TonB-linked outer membrane protein [Lewinella sp.]
MKRLFFKLRPSTGRPGMRSAAQFSPRSYLSLLFVLGLPLMLAAQTVKGVVSDPDGETLIGVNILVKGTSTGTVTDFDGNYELTVPGTETILIFSYTGYTSEEVTVGAQQVINITLAPDAEVLEEVVVVGYGVVRKSDLTGSVAKMGGEELTAVVAGNPTSALQGKLSGVQVENNGGEPGGATNVFVRGVSSLTNSYPLYVIDGTFADNMNFVNPKDIQSIEVLKDASSAAIYGSRAANGVVLVTTKRGTEDGAPQVSLDIRTGIEAPAKLLDYLDGAQFVQYRNQLEQNDNTGFVFPNTGVSTDWQDLSLNSGAIQDYGLSVSGGNAGSKYYVSGNFFDQDGILVGSDFNRVNLRANSEFNLGRFKITESLSLVQSQTQSNNWFGFDGATAPILRESVPENDGGFEAPNFDDHNFGGYNDFALATLEDNKTTRRNVLGNVNLGYEIIDGLTARLNLGLDYVNTNAFQFNPTYFMSPSDATVNVNEQNDLMNTRGEALQTQIEPTLSYNKDIGVNSRIDAVIGATSQRQNFQSVGISGQGTPNNDIRVTGALAPANILATEGVNTTSVLRSLFARVNYSLNRKYLLSATIRRDESSRFAKDFRVGYFPSASIGWNVSQEDFWNQDGTINKLKLRAGYGELGAQNIPDYAFQSVFNLNSPTSFGGQIVPGYAQTSFALENLKWETSRTTNVGVDVGLLNDKITFTAEYYIKDVSDVLVGVALPASTGTAVPVIQNVGAIRNSGFEFDGVYHAINTSGFKLDFGWNFTTFSSEVTSLPNPIVGPSISEDATRVNRFVEGQAPGVYFGFITEGVYADQAAIDSDQNISNDEARRSLVSPGDFIRKDLNGDGMINNEDQTILGDPTPDFIYGFNFSGKAGNLDFGVFFQGSQGNEIYNVNKFYNIFWADDNKLTDVLDGWTPSNRVTDIPRATTLDQAENRAPSSFFVEDGSYLRLRTLELGYTLGTDNVDWLGNLRVFVTGQNLVTLTGYSGYNPDISSAAGGRAGSGVNPLLSRGLDIRAYPLSRSFMFGIQANF